MDHTPTYDYREVMKLSNQLCFPLYAAARKVTALYTPFLTELNLTYTQYLVLLVLWEQDGIPVSEICRRLHLDNGTERAKEIPGKVGSCVRLTPGKALTLYQLLYELLDEE